MPRKHTIFLIHGIRTHAGWYERARQVFAQIEGVEIEPIKYGRFDLFRFLVPGPWRRGPIDRSEDRILPIIDRCKKQNHLISVIAHSNGTHVAATLLKESHLFRIDNLILCGSVVDTNFDWESVSHKVSGTIINDYGVRDVWPALAKSFTWGYGYSGTRGFGAPVKDRMHDTTHSAYFTKDFMEKYWISFFKNGSIVWPEYSDDEIPQSPRWFDLFEIPWKWLIFLVMGAIVVWGLAPSEKDEGEAAGLAKSEHLYTYYEVDFRGMPAEAGDLRLEERGGVMPKFGDLKDDTILKVMTGKFLRRAPTTESEGISVGKDTCLRVLPFRKLHDQDDGNSGGWIEVKPVPCSVSSSSWPVADEAEENNEIAVFSPECDRTSYAITAEEISRVRKEAELVNTMTWMNIAFSELGQREFSGEEANPRIVAYMATAEPKLTSDESPWNSQFVNYVMRKSGKNGTNSGLARSWLNWGKDAVAEVGDSVVGSIVVASRKGVPAGGVAGFYLGDVDNDSIRMIAGNVCREVSIVKVPKDRILGYRLPSGWIGPAQ